uniref:aspartate transaminase n=1 Tax=Stegastes partitus TaxID=144197 RepID=A0A3B4YTI5_9TELE
MSRPGSSVDEKGVNQNGDPGGHLSVFSNTHTAALTTEIRLLSAFKRDTQARKVYLAGRGECTFEPHLVGKIKQQLSADPTLHPEYPSSFGLVEFIRQATQVALGRSSRAIVENRVFGVQTPGFNAAVRLGAELLKHLCDVSAAWCGPVYLSFPCDVAPTSYLESYFWSLHCFQQRRRLFPFLLLPAQALCYGDLERDAWPVRYFASQGIEVLCAQSFSHCFGLYGEAVGHLLCILKHNSLLLSVQSQADKIVRSLWAQPSVGGARVVATVLSNSAHLVEWQGDVKRIVERCMLIRAVLREKLRLLGTPGCWDHLTQQGGLFCCTGLNGQQVEFLSNCRHVYLLPSGCLNVSAINSRNLDYIAESIRLALTTSL